MKNRILKSALVASVILFLTGCAASFDHSIKEEGKSIVLLSLQTVPDFEPNSFLDPAHKIHSYSPLFSREDETFKGNRKAFDQSSDRLTFWLAYAQSPGTYSINGFADRAETREGAILIGQPPLRVTDFNEAGGPLTYEVGAGEIVYIGTFRSQLTTKKTDALLARRFVEAHKTYVLQTDEAKRVIQKLALPEATFKQIDLFAGRPEALALYERPLTSIPIED